MRFDLAALTKRTRNPRRSTITLRPIKPTAIQASDLFDIYRPVIEAWRGAIPTIMATYERTLAEMVTDAPADLAADISQVDNTLFGLSVAIRLRLERWAQVVEVFHRRRWTAAVRASTGVDISALIGPADARLTLQAVIESNVALVKSVSDQARTRISEAVFRGLRENRPSREVAKELREALGMSRRRALNIASDQSVKIHSALNEERRREAGISAWKWLHSGKVHFRDVHKARDGKLYSDDPKDVGDEYEGQTIRKPPEDLPGRLPFCGCTSRAVLIL